MAYNTKETSPYSLTPVKDWYLDVTVHRRVPKNDYDKTFVITTAFENRPDLLSYQEYGTARLWWVFAARNPDILIDPIEDFKAGLEIYIPENILKL